jgi:hypothetical protein
MIVIQILVLYISLAEWDDDMTYLYVDYPFYKKFTMYATAISVSLKTAKPLIIHEYHYKIDLIDVLIAVKFIVLVPL